MANNDNNIQVEIGVNAQNADQNIKNFQKTIDSFCNNTQRELNNLNNAFKNVNVNNLNLKPAEEKVKGVENAVKSFSGNVKKEFEKVGEYSKKVTEGFEKIGKGMLVLSGIIAGGKVLGDFVKDAQKATEESRRLAIALQIPVTEASALKIAIEDVGGSTEDYMDLTRGLQKQLHSNEDAFKNNGIATRDAAGNFRALSDIMRDSLENVNSYKEGQDRIQQSLMLFGKSGDDAIRYLNITKEMLGETAKKAKELNLVITNESVQANQNYKGALNELNDIFDGVKNTIGQTLIPMLTSLAEWFISAGPSAVEATKDAMIVLQGAFDATAEAFGAFWDLVKDILNLIADGFSEIVSFITEVFNDFFGGSGEAVSGAEFFKNVCLVISGALSVLATVFKMGMEGIRTALDIVIQSLKIFASVAIAAFNLDWAGVKSAWDTGLKDLSDTVLKHAERMDKIKLDGIQNFNVAVGAEQRKPTTKSEYAQPDMPNPTGSKKYSGPGASSSSMESAKYALRKAELEAELALYREVSREEQAINDDLYKRNQLTIEEYYNRKKKLIEEDFKMQIKMKELEMQEVGGMKGKDGAENLKIQAKVVQLQGQLNLLKLQEANAQKDINREMQTALRDEQRRLELNKMSNTLKDYQANIAIEKQYIELQMALQKMSVVEAIELERQRADEVYALQKEQIEKKKALYADDKLKLEETLNEELELERQHAVEVARLTKEAKIAQAQDYISLVNTVRDSFTQMFSDIAQRPREWKEAMMNALNSVANRLVQIAAQRLMENAFGGGQMGSGGGLMGGALSSFAGLFGMNSFDVGTNYVPNDQIAKIHKGEAIIPARYNNPETFGAGKKTQQTSMTNNFNFSQMPDKRTQQQMASMVYASMNNAVRRNS